jgi:Flp pilus assembly protein TadD
MMLALLMAASVAAANPVDPRLLEAAHAINTGRLEQARTMIGNAVAAGASGPPVERLLADLAFVSGRNDEALTRYKILVAGNPADLLLAERAGIAALKAGDVERATVLIERAVTSAAPSWRAWNARGVLADLQRDWPAADAAFSRAAQLAPAQAEIFNNQGWSQLLRGNWGEAIAPLERAADLDPQSVRIADNLELARAAIAGDLPSRRQGESDQEWAARLNDAGVVARLRDDNVRAIAAFSRAIEARGVWYERAANNLRLAQSQK